MNSHATVVAVAALLTIVLRTLLLNVGHNWDMETFFYLGSRLAHGELLYVRDFETKLPLVQYLFFVPYCLGGIGAWRLTSFILVSGIYLLGTAVIVGCLQRVPHTDVTRRVTTTVVIVLILGYTLPDAESAPIAMLAGAMLFLSMALLHVGLAREARHAMVWFGAGAAAAVAASIRPNLVYTIPALAAVAPLSRLITANQHSLASVSRDSAVFLGGFVGAATLQFVPYFFVQDGITALLGGLGALSNFSTARPLAVNLRFQVSFLPLLALIASSYAWLFVRLRRGIPRDERFARHAVAVSLGAVLGMAGLEFQMLKQHCWPNYGHMLLPFVALAAAYAVALAGTETDSASVVSTTLDRSLLLVITLAFVLHLALFAVRESKALASNADRYRLSWQINARGGDHKLKEFLLLVKARGISFYAPYDANCHWQLDEARIGDGHPSMFMAVMGGRFRTSIGVIPLYNDDVRRSPCLLFRRSGKDLIVVPRQDTTACADAMIRCLEGDRDEVDPATVLGENSFAPAAIEHLLKDYRFFLSRQTHPAAL